MYAKFFKRFFDFILSLLTLIVLSPVMLVLTIVGAIKMKGNPFFTQLRPGKNEKIFKLVKYRTMTCEKDENGSLLPDEKRLTKYGRWLRRTSLDELPELFNITMGQLAVIGPRPLLIEYLPWYSDTEKHRHDVRPGLTGWAQVNGRNSLKWDKRLALDIEYVNNISFLMDVKIFFLTIKKVLVRSDVAEDTRIAEGNFADIRKAKATEVASKESVKQ